MFNRITEFWSIHWKSMFILAVVYGLLFEFPFYIIDLVFGGDNPGSMYFILFVVVTIVYAPLSLNFYGAFLDLANQKSLKIKKVLKCEYIPLKQAYPLFFLTTIYLIGWFFLFIIPGFVKSIAYALSPLIRITEKNLSTNEVITDSRRFMDGHKGQYFLYSLIGFIPYFLIQAIAEYINPFVYGVIITIGYGLLMTWIASTTTMFFKEYYKGELE